MNRLGHIAWKWGGVAGGKVAADSLISKCPSVSGASVGTRSDSADGQIVSRQQLQYSMQDVGKKCALIFTAVLILRCTVFVNSYKPWKLLPSSQLSPSCLSLYFWMKQTFCVCDLEEEEEKKKLSTSHHRWGAKRLWKPSGEKRVLELDVLMTERGGKKKIMRHLLSVFWLTCSFVEHKWHLRFISAWKRVCVRWRRQIRGWQMLEMFWISHWVCLFICDCVPVCHLENTATAVEPRNGFLKCWRRGDVW